MNAVIAHWEAVPKASTERSSVENPPVGSVLERVGHRLEEAHALVGTADPEEPERADHRHRQPDVEDPQPPRGVADRRRELLELGPGASDSMSWRSSTRSRGSTASASTMIPMPPSHWVNWRHMTSERERPTSVTTLEPVVVEAGHRLEEGVHRLRDLGLVGEQVGERSTGGRAEPGEGDDEEALAYPDALLALGDPFERQAEAGADRPTEARNGQTGSEYPSARPPGEEREAQVLDERADEVERGADVDAPAARVTAPFRPRARGPTR